MIQIEQIRPELTWRVRQRVMYPDGTLADVQLAEDNNGYHFGAFEDNYLVGVISLFQNGDDFQFRKFAVDVAVQNTGIGSLLLKHILDFALAGGARRIWCSARVSAISFYHKFGMIEKGQPFTKNNIEYIIMEKVF